MRRNFHVKLGSWACYAAVQFGDPQLIWFMTQFKTNKLITSSISRKFNLKSRKREIFSILEIFTPLALVAFSEVDLDINIYKRAWNKKKSSHYSAHQRWSSNVYFLATVLTKMKNQPKKKTLRRRRFLHCLSDAENDERNFYWSYWTSISLTLACSIWCHVYLHFKQFYWL